MNKHLAAVPLEKAYRLINHGPTVLVSAQHDGVDDVMAAAWCCGLDYTPPKLTEIRSAQAPRFSHGVSAVRTL